MGECSLQSAGIPITQIATAPLAMAGASESGCTSATFKEQSTRHSDTILTTRR